MNKQYKQIQQSEKGFSIIEVVLVLAIAGLIFLMVFIALPALQRGQRDTGRKNDVSTVTSALQTYMSNNRGSLSTLTTAKLADYVDTLGQYDKTSASELSVASGTAAITASETSVQVRTSAKCPAENPAPGTLNTAAGATSLQAGSSRQAAVVTALENNGSQRVFFCQNL